MQTAPSRQDESTNYPICVVGRRLTWAGHLTSIIDSWNINEIHRTSILRCTGVWPGGLQFGPEPMLVSTGLEFETVEVVGFPIQSIAMDGFNQVPIQTLQTEAISIDTPVPQAIYDEGSLSISSYRGGYIGKTMKQFSDPVAEAEGRPEELEVNADCSLPDKMNRRIIPSA
ncbi:hypothetical protein BLNAU_24585 [Blattamonas nauphoetae]|uniref:Uncharacterized protein n=1 Tax=Blattamonas nauphoetae TaxID=2049346 RepID=A0ABQ9WM32_9EUKA|nr:hypothetical protein BLNAU_24585 [Blattamonas nauphoetae]